MDIEFTEQELADGKELLTAVMDANPELCAEGFISQFYQERLNKSRLSLMNNYLETFLLAIRWLSRLKSTKNVYKRFTSYTVKHIAERDPIFGKRYCPNGVIIAACLHCGIKIERTGPNAYLALSLISLRKAEERTEQSRKILQMQAMQQQLSSLGMISKW